MKLNKSGWGLKEMLVLSGILILFLFIAIYFIYTMYNSLDGDLNKSYYEELEQKLENQAQVFVTDYYNEELTSEKLTITRNILKSYNLDIDLVDTNNDACSGYVIAYKQDSKNYIKGYIKCPNYMTDGYEGWRSS